MADIFINVNQLKDKIVSEQKNNANIGMSVICDYFLKIIDDVPIANVRPKIKIKDLINFKVFWGAEFRNEMGEKIIDDDIEISDITDIGVIEEICDRDGIKLPQYHPVVYIISKSLLND